MFQNIYLSLSGDSVLIFLGILSKIYCFLLSLLLSYQVFLQVLFSTFVRFRPLMENILCDFTRLLAHWEKNVFELEYVRYGLVTLMVVRGLVPVVSDKFPVFLFAILVFHRGKPPRGPPLRLGFFPVRFPVVPLFVLKTFLLCSRTRSGH